MTNAHGEGEKVTAPQRVDRADFDHYEWAAMAYRLLLAHLEPDRDQGYWFAELVRIQCGYDDLEFKLADRLARECVRLLSSDDRKKASEYYLKKLEMLT